jgi:putative serine protease PepD
VRFFGGRQIPAEVVASDVRRDIALVRTESVSLTGLPLRLEKPELSAPVFVIGSPLGSDNEGSVITGIVSAFRDSEQGPFIQSDVPVTHGNSGGPMFDEKGNVIGLVDIGKLGNDGVAVAINLFIPIGDALKTLKIDFTPAATAAKSPSR